jgi:tetratricopeptide (TPR) repeat protein
MWLEKYFVDCSKKTIALILFLIGLALYFNMFSNHFVNYDDTSFLNRYPALRVGGLIDIFKTVTIGHYYPISNLTMAFDFQMCSEGGLICFRMTSFFLHVINAFLLFLLLQKCFFLKTINALFAAVFFLVAGMNSEAVLWFSARNHLVSVLFLQATLLLFFSARKKDFRESQGESNNGSSTNNGTSSNSKINAKDNGQFELKNLKHKKTKKPLPTEEQTLGKGLIIFYLLALLSKSLTSFSLLLMIAWDFLNHNFKKSLLLKLILSVIFFITLFFAYRISTDGTGIITQIQTLNFSERILLVFQELCWYLRQFFFPIKLSVFYDIHEFKVKWYDYLLMCLILATTIYYYIKTRDKLLILAWLWFLVFILPVSKLISFGDDAIVADRYMYTAGIGLILLMTCISQKLIPKLRTPFMILTLLSLIWNTFITFERTLVWHDSASLWQNVLDNYPETPTAWLNKGILKLDDKKWPEAEFAFTKVIELKPQWPNGYFNLGIVFENTGRLENAIALYQTSIEKFPDLEYAYIILYDRLKQLGKKSEALQLIEKAFSLFPQSEEVIKRFQNKQ